MEEFGNLQIMQDATNFETSVISKASQEIKEPSMYKVLLHNDDFTPMDFVVRILQEVFHKDQMVANKIMLDVHQKGIGCCGVYTYDIAETKTSMVTELAREGQYPLKCTMERTS